MATYTVYDDASWQSAFKKAKDGDIINVTGGNFTITPYYLENLLDYGVTLNGSKDAAITISNNYAVGTFYVYGTFNTNGMTITRDYTSNKICVFSGAEYHQSGGKNSHEEIGPCIVVSEGGTASFVDTDAYIVGAEEGTETSSIAVSGSHIGIFWIETDCCTATVKDSTIDNASLQNYKQSNLVNLSNVKINTLLRVDGEVTADHVTIGKDAFLWVNDLNSLKNFSDFTFLSESPVVVYSGTVYDGVTANVGNFCGCNVYRAGDKITIGSGGTLNFQDGAEFHFTGYAFSCYGTFSFHNAALYTDSYTSAGFNFYSGSTFELINSSYTCTLTSTGVISFESGVEVIMRDSTFDAPNVRINFESGCKADITGISGDFWFSFEKGADVSIRKCDFSTYHFTFYSGAKVDLSGNYWGGKTLEEVLAKFESDDCLSYVTIDNVLAAPDQDQDFYCLNSYFDKKKNSVILTFNTEVGTGQELEKLLSIADNAKGRSCKIASATVSGNKIEVKFDRVDDETEYTIKVSPSLRSSNGISLDQNQNGIPGESADGFTGLFDVTGNGFVVSDLTVSTSSATSGDEISVSLNVANRLYTELPEAAAVGIYLSTDAVFDASDRLLAQKSLDSLKTSGEKFTFDITTLGVSEGEYHLIARAASASEAKENNVAVADCKNMQAKVISVTVPTLAVGKSVSGSYSGKNTSDVYKLTQQKGETVRLALTQSGSSVSELFIGYGSAPTREVFAQKITVTGKGEIVLPAALADTDVYILLNDKNGQTGNYVLSAEKMSATILSVSPEQTAADKSILFEIRGTVFSNDAQISITGADGKKRTLDTKFVDDTFLTAEVAAQTLTAGKYSVSVTSGGKTVNYGTPVTVTASGKADFQYELSMPAALGNHIISEISFDYANRGTAAMDAPLIFVTAEQNGQRGAIMTMDESLLTTGFWTYNLPEGYSNTVSFLATGENGSVLQPGMDEQSVSFYWAGWQQPWDFSYPPFKFKVAVVDSTDTTAVNWSDLLAGTDYPAEYKSVLIKALQEKVGTTMGAYVKMLNRNLRQQNELGVSEQLSAEKLLDIELRSVSGAYGNTGTLVDTADLALATQGLALTFRRTKSSVATEQYRDGMLGYGWSTNWDASLEVDSDGTVSVALPGGATHTFEPKVNGGYVSFSQGVSLAVSGGAYTVTDGNDIKYSFGSDGKLTKVADVNGNAISTVYSGNKLTRLNHTDGSYLAFTYDQNGRIASVSGSDGSKATYTYDANGNLTKVADASGAATDSYAYDSTFKHHLVSATERDGSKVKYTYDSYGRLTGAAVDGKGNTLTVSYDGATTTVKHQSGYSLSTSYDSSGRVLRVADSLGNRVSYTYDADGNLLKQRDADGNTVTYTYDAKGHCLSVTDALNRKTVYTYSGDNVRTVTDCLGNTATYTYDAKNQVTKIEYSDGTSVSMVYDKAGNVTELTDAKGIKSVMTYDAKGNPLSVSRNGKTVTYTYDAKGNPTGYTDAAGKSRTFVYDARGQITGFTDANGSKTTYAYDAGGNLSSVTYANGKSEKFATDLYGNLVSWTNMRGDQMTATVDSLGQVTGSYVAGKDRSFTYTATGELATAGDMSFTYDRAGRLTAMSYADGRRVNYEYNAAGQLVKQSDETGKSTNYSYDIYGNIDKISDKAGALVADYDFNRLGQLVKQTNGNGTYTTWSYTATGEVERIAYYDKSGKQTGFCGYAYDNDGLCTAKTTETGAWVYTYDKNGRLLGEVFTATGGKVTQNNSYTYDAAGNRLTKTVNGKITTYIYDNMNRIVSANGFVYRYDADGNLLEDEERVYTWTKDNRVASEKLKSSGQVWSYTYDALGNRTGVTTNGVTTNYTVDVNGNVLAEYVNGKQTRSYYQGLSLVGFNTVDGKYYFDADLLGSTVAVTNAGGSRVNTYSYDAFGNSLAVTEGVANDFEFVGGYGLMANGSGTTFVRARNYDADTGRWISMDPIGISGGENLYVYCENNPVTYVDVNGYRFHETSVGLKAAAGIGFHGEVGVVRSDDGHYFIHTNSGAGFGLGGGISGGKKTYDSLPNNSKSIVGSGSASFGPIGMSVNAKLEKNRKVSGDADWSFSNPLPISSEIYVGIEAVDDRYYEVSKGTAFVTELLLTVPATVLDSMNSALDMAKNFVEDTALNIAESLRQKLIDSLRFSDSGSADDAGSFDPNDMIGPKGYGDKHAITADSTLTYTVMCENDPELANAPVRWLRINSTLDKNLDLDTFTIDAFYIAGNYVKLDGGLDSYNQRRTMTVNGTEVTLDFAINLDAATRELAIEVTAIDPATDFMLQDTAVGFLYPNDASGIGDAYFVYSLKAKDGVADGTVITNQADIYFDFNDVIPTPEYSNLIDDAPPVKPTAKADITTATNKNVTVTATFSSDSAQKEYSLDNKTWQEYKSGIVFSENGTVWFRAFDGVGHASEVASYKVANIDKVAPATPSAKADITTSTSKAVTVTATFSNDSAQKQYSTDQKTWKTYSSGVVMSKNGTVYFRGIDAAGNISAVTNYAVSNIIVDKFSHDGSVAPGKEAKFTPKLEAAGLYTVSGTFKTAKGSVTVVDKTGKKVGSGAVKGGVITFKNALLLDNSNTYTVVVKNTDKKSTSSAYSLELKAKELFTKGDTTDNTKAGAKTLAAGSTVNDWVGYGDAVDYYKLGVNAAGGIYDLSLSGVKNNVRLTVYTKNGAKVKSVTASAKKPSIPLADLCLDNGSYAVIEAPKAAKAQNSDYALKLTEKATFKRSNNDWSHAEVLTMDATFAGALSKATGGDTVDYCDVSALDNLSFTNTAGKVKVSFFDTNKQAVKVAVKTGGKDKTAAAVSLTSGKTDNFTIGTLPSSVKYLKIEAAGKTLNSYTLGKIA